MTPATDPIAPDHLGDTTLADLTTAADDARRDARATAVCEI